MRYGRSHCSLLHTRRMATGRTRPFRGRVVSNLWTQERNRTAASQPAKDIFREPSTGSSREDTHPPPSRWDVPCRTDADAKVGISSGGGTTITAVRARLPDV